MKTNTTLLLILAVSLVLGSCGMNRGNFNKQKFTKLKKIEHTIEEDVIDENDVALIEKGDIEDEVQVEYVEEEIIASEEFEEDPEAIEGFVLGQASDQVDLFHIENEELEYSEDSEFEEEEFEVLADEVNDEEYQAELKKRSDIALAVALSLFFLGMIALVTQVFFFVQWAISLDLFSFTWNSYAAGDLIAGISAFALLLSAIVVFWMHFQLRIRSKNRPNGSFYLWILALIALIISVPNVIVCALVWGS